MAARNFLIWGVHAVKATLTRASDRALELWLRDGDLSDELRHIQTLAETTGVATQIVPPKSLARLTDGAVHQGVVLRRRNPPELNLADYIERLVNPPSAPLLLVLDQVQDPQNFGACLRVADGAGADAVLAPRDHSAAISGTVAKAASGALDSIPIIYAPNLARALDELRDAGMWMVGASHEARDTIYACDLKSPVGLVFGGEGGGLRALTRKKCDELACIPMNGAVASLNVATAAAIALFEARRQRAAT